MKWSPAWGGFIIEAGDERELAVFQCKPKRAILFFDTVGAVLREGSVPVGIRRYGEDAISMIDPEQLDAWLKWGEADRQKKDPAFNLRDYQQRMNADLKRLCTSLTGSPSVLVSPPSLPSDMIVAVVASESVVAITGLEVHEHIDPTNAQRNRSEGERMQDLARAAALGVREPVLVPPPISDKYLFKRSEGIRESDAARVTAFINQKLTDDIWEVIQRRYRIEQRNDPVSQQALIVAPMEGFRSSGVIFGAD